MKTFKRVILLMLLALFVAAESMLFLSARREHEIDDARKISEEIEKSINQMRGAVLNSNEESYLRALEKYDSALAQFENNEYVHSDWQELLEALKEGRVAINGDIEYTKSLMALRAEIREFNNKLDSLEPDVSQENLTKLAQYYAELADDLTADNETLAPVAEKYQHMAKAVAELAESVAPCVNVCTDSTMKARRVKLDWIIEHYGGDLEALNTKLFEHYPYDDLLSKIENFQRATIKE